MRLILHAGTHKTGTKTIQRCLFQNREVLAASGVAYPIIEELPPKRQMRSTNWLAHAFTGACAFSPEQAAAEVESAASIVGDKGTVLISAEDLSACCLGFRLWTGFDRRDFRSRQEEYLTRIAEAFRGFDIEVLLVFRRADEFAQSLDQWLISGGDYHGSFESFLSYAAPLFDYATQYQTFKRVFGRPKLMCFHGPNLIERFVEVLGIDGIGCQKMRTKNRSTDARLTYWMNAQLALNDFAREEVVQLKKFIRSSSARDLFPDFRSASFWRRKEDRAAFHARCVRDLPLSFPPSHRADGPDARLDTGTLQRITECYIDWLKDSQTGLLHRIRSNVFMM